MARADGALHCHALPSSCLTLNEPQPSCSSQCANRNRAFRIDVHAPSARQKIKQAVAATSGIRDPIASMSFRHLERDLFPSSEAAPLPIAPGSQFSMLWPNWEGGFGDLHMWTMLPLGLALRDGSLPNCTLGISGALYSRAWHALSHARSICTFERYDTYEVPDGANTVRESVHNPLPRCAPTRQCFETLHLCRPTALPPKSTRPWEAQSNLDGLLGFPHLPLGSSSHYSTSKVLKVIIARRHSWHGRSLLNGHELAKACSKSSVSDHSGVSWALSCQLISLGSLPLRKVVSTMRSADVLVSMHGADVINGLHLPPGRAVIEIVNHNFDKSQDVAPFWFVSCFERQMARVYQHKRIIVKPVLRGEQSPGRAWNLNATVPLPLLQRALTSVVKRDGVNRIREMDKKEANGPSAAVKAQLPLISEVVDRDAKDGYCAFTDFNEGDCDNGASGSFEMGSRLPDARHCHAACLSCPRCRYVSMSLEQKECSWFHSCKLNKLNQEPKGFRSWLVRS